jgi:hypothetical protein
VVGLREDFVTSLRARSVAAGTVVLFLGGAVLALLTPNGDANATIGNVGFVLTVAAFTAVGYLLATRLPRNRVGWLCLAIGALFAVVIASSSTARWGLATGSLPTGLCEWIDVPANGWVVALGLLGTQLPLRLPDGELPSPRWRWFSRLTLVLIAVALVPIATTPGLVENAPGTANPIGAPWGAGLGPLLLLLIASFAGSFASLIVRFRRAGTAERAQLKWIAFGGSVFVVVYAIGVSVDQLLTEGSAASTVVEGVLQLAFAILPIAIGHAVLRRNLYDLGAVVNRTVVYTALTVLLAAVYTGLVLLLQLVLAPLTRTSGPAVAVSTLAVAALFRPVRARVQATVDRRFYRNRYDARRTLDAFVARLRDEIELPAVEQDLTTTVQSALHPSSLSVWLPRP